MHPFESAEHPLFVAALDNPASDFESRSVAVLDEAQVHLDADRRHVFRVLRIDGVRLPLDHMRQVELNIAVNDGA